MAVVAELVTKLGFQVDESAVGKALATYKEVDARQAALAKKLNDFAAAGGALNENVAKALRNRLTAPVKAAEKACADALAAQLGLGGRKPALPPVIEDLTKFATLEPDAPVRGLGSAFAALKVAAGAFLGLGAVQYLRGLSHEMMGMASQVSHLAERVGVSTDAIQELQYAAKDSDVEVGTLTTGLRSLQVQAEAAKAGSKESAKAFAAFGISAKEAAALPIDALLERVADAFKGTDDASQKAALAQKIFGRAGGELIPLLNQGSEGLRELRAEARALGGGLSEDAIATFGELEKSTKKMDFALLGLKSTLGQAIIPTLTRLLEIGNRVLGWFVDMNKKSDLLATGGLTALVFALTRVSGALDVGKVASWVKAWAPVGLLALKILAIAVAVDEIVGLFTGKKTIVSEWLAQFGYLEKIDQWVRNIAAGLKEISELGVTKALSNAAQGAGESFAKQQDQDRRRYLEGRLAPGADAPLTADERAAFSSELETLNRTGRGRGGSGGPPVIRRAVAQGIAAQAVDANSLKRLTVGVGTNSDVNNIVNNVSVNVEAKTAASPADIAAAVQPAVTNALQQQIQQTRAALAPKKGAQ